MVRHLGASILAVATFAAAQDPGPAEAEAAARARELLRHEDPAQRAWGAHWAVVSGDEGLTPELLRASLQVRGEDDRSRLARRAIATALVDLRAEMPPAELERLAREFPREALCCAARDAERYQGVLERLLARDLDANAWTATVELLLPLDSLALTAHLLRGLETRLIVRVIDPDGERVVGASSDSWHRNERVAVPHDFPPLALISFTRNADGAEVLADGVLVFALRTKVAAGEHGELRHLQRDAVAHGLQRYTYLRHLLSQEVPDFVEHSGYVVAWKDADALAAKLDELRAARAGAWRAAIEDLVAQRKLDAEVAAALPPRIRFVIEDARTEKEPPLPPAPAVVGEQVRIGSIYWQTDYDAALALARELKKPLLLHFGEHPG